MKTLSKLSEDRGRQLRHSVNIFICFCISKGYNDWCFSFIKFYFPQSLKHNQIFSVLEKCNRFTDFIL